MSATTINKEFNYTLTVPAHLFPQKKQEPVNIYEGSQASFFSRFFMMLREIPFYLSTARALRFKADTEGKNIFQQYKTLIKEILGYCPSQKNFQKNIDRLDKEFSKMTDSVAENTKPICAYFVSSHDHNGAILGDHLYYYHHYKIHNFEKQYAVAAKIIKTPGEEFQFLKQLKEKYPHRPVQLIDVVSHGDPDQICIPRGNGKFYTCADVKKDEFKDCAKDACIILDACSTGEGARSIAEKIAKMNPGKTVIAPGTELFFSKPIICEKNGKPFVQDVVHGLAIADAFSAKKFKYLS